METVEEFVSIIMYHLYFPSNPLHQTVTDRMIAASRHIACGGICSRECNAQSAPGIFFYGKGTYFIRSELVNNGVVLPLKLLPEACLSRVHNSVGYFPGLRTRLHQKVRFQSYERDEWCD